jgi:hypothetical protein
VNPGLASLVLGNRSIRGWLLAAAALVFVSPVLVAAAISGVLAQENETGCQPSGLAGVPAGGTLAAGLFAAPLTLQPGRSYQVGATEYGGPGDPSSGSYGAIPDPGESYLPAHPDSYAELSVLSSNFANHGTFTFADANALGRLPYLTGLRVEHHGQRLVLLKRDIGYGQGPGQTIPNGQPYRLDVWWRAARALAITKSQVTVTLAPPSGAAATLEALPATEPAGEGCETGAALTGPLPLIPGTAARILPSGLAAAGEGSPPLVKAMIAAGNRLHDAGYLYGAGHGVSLDTLQNAYDCSSAVSYVLHAAGLLGVQAWDSTELESFGVPGPGRYVTIYANAAHAFMYVAGLRLDTVEDAAYDSGPNAGKPGPKWRVSPAVPDWASWTVRHPPGL